VVDKLLRNNPIVLQMQEELRTGMTLEQTAANFQLGADMDALRKKHEEEIKKARGGGSRYESERTSHKPGRRS
jgi:hypothetical protein